MEVQLWDSRYRGPSKLETGMASLGAQSWRRLPSEHWALRPGLRGRAPEDMKKSEEGKEEAVGGPCGNPVAILG